METIISTVALVLGFVCVLVAVFYGDRFMSSNSHETQKCWKNVSFRWFAAAVVFAIVTVVFAPNLLTLR